MFGRFEAYAIRTFFTAQLKRFTFNRITPWNKLQLDLHKKQETFLSDIKTILIDPTKTNEALRCRQSFFGSGSRKSQDGHPLAVLCSDGFNPKEKLANQSTRIVDFMRASFDEYKSNKDNVTDELTTAMSAETATDAQRVAVLLDAACFKLSVSYFEDNQSRINKISEANQRANQPGISDQDPIFFTCNKTTKNL